MVKVRVHKCSDFMTGRSAYMCRLLTESTISCDLEFALEPFKRCNLPVVAENNFFRLIRYYT